MESSSPFITEDQNTDANNNTNNTNPNSIYIPEVDYSKKLKLINLTSIKTYLTYINTDNEIETIRQKKLSIERGTNIVTRSQLINIVKENQKRHNVKYKLMSVMVHNINVTPDTLASYIENPGDFISLFTLSRIDSFELQPTISMLKQYNGIYFFFFECPPDPASSSTASASASSLSKNRTNHTRRVYIANTTNRNKTKRYDSYIHRF
jgi:hypothetical protein